MKRLSLKSLTLLLALSVVITTLALPSCKSPSITTVGNQQFSSSLREMSDSIALRDSTHTRDSIFESVRQQADTIFRERVVFRDRVQYRDRWRERVVHDTIVRTDSIAQVIEHPPERYIPPFYKRCTLFFWLILVTSALYMIGKIYLKRRL